MDDSPLGNTNSIMINKNRISMTPYVSKSITTSLTVKATTSASTEASLSSSSSHSSELSSSSNYSSNQLNDDPSVLQILNKEPNGYFNVYQSDKNNNQSEFLISKSNSSNLIENLLIKKSQTFDDASAYDHHQQQQINNGGGISSSTSSNSISNNSTLTKSISNQLMHALDVNSENQEIESAAKKYRCSAQNSEATCSWKGKLPPKAYRTPIVYSTKVFVGGLPWDIIEEDLIKEFGQFGPCRVEWTNKEKFNLLSQNSNNNQLRSYRSFNQNSNDMSSKQRSSPGFAYVVYENEFSVRGLVNNCIEDYANGRDRVEYYFKISTRRVRNKEVQIIPWILADNNFALCTPKELDPKKTVFVGNLHGTMTARDLAHIMDELFGSVVYAGIDIDKLKYPIGSGRVTFANQQNFMLAIRAAFVDIQSVKFTKRIQIDPYLEDVQCCICIDEKGVYFCRDFQCFNYYCGSCWSKQHSFDALGSHKPLMRKREDK